MSVCTCKMPDFQHAICPVHNAKLSSSIPASIQDKINAGEAGQYEAAVLWQELQRLTELIPEIIGSSQFYVCQETAMAPGIADGWPDVIPAPHSKNGRLKKCLTSDLAAKINLRFAQAAPAGSCSEPRTEAKREICQACCTEVCIHRRCPNCHKCSPCTLEKTGKPFPEEAATAVPFILPLKPDPHWNDSINDGQGVKVALMFGDEGSPLTRKQRDYIIAAVNSHEELKRQIDELSQRGDNWKANYHSENDDKKLWQRKTASAEQQKEELLKALEAMNALFDDEGYFNELAQDQLSAALELSEKAIAKYKRGDQQ